MNKVQNIYICIVKANKNTIKILLLQVSYTKPLYSFLDAVERPKPYLYPVIHSAKKKIHLPDIVVGNEHLVQ